MKITTLGNGSIFKMDDGSVMMKMRNLDLRPLQDINKSYVWAIDIGNGVFNKGISPTERVEYIGKAYDLIFKTDLLYAVKMAYRKHHLNDDSIGWEELGSILMTAMCKVLGDDGYYEWLNEINKQSN